MCYNEAKAHKAFWKMEICFRKAVKEDFGRINELFMEMLRADGKVKNTAKIWLFGDRPSCGGEVLCEQQR